VLGTRAYPANGGEGLGKLKLALLAGRSATRFAGSATPETLGDILPRYYNNYS